MGQLSVISLSDVRDLLRWRWWLAAALAIIIVIIETLEHHWLQEVPLGGEYWSEIITYGILLPLTGGLILALVNQVARKSLEKAVQMERQNIVRELHDSIGQNLNFAHHKLEQMISLRPLDPNIVSDLGQVQVAVDEAFRQVRGTLIHLDKSRTTDFVAALFNLAGMIEKRAGFSMQSTTEGLPSHLPLNTQLAIVSIVREALINIEKHARARKVHLQVKWGTDALMVRLSDDGRGFHPELVLPYGHFGLKDYEAESQRDLCATRL